MPRVKQKAVSTPRINGDSEQKILAAAMQLFTREGLAAFTTRGVAKEAGLSLGAVQHFFRTKDELIAAMLQKVMSDYSRGYDKLEAELPFNGEARLLGVIDFLVADVWRPESRKFFYNLYALSCHNEFAARLVNDTSAHHRRRVAGYIGAARPRLSDEQCLDIGLQISALIDGLMIYTGPGAKSVTPRSRLAQMVRETALCLIDSPSKSTAGK